MRELRLAELRYLYGRFYERPFPLATINHPAEWDIKSDLVLFDAETAGLISRLLKGESMSPNTFFRNVGLEDRIRALSTHEQIDLAVTGKRYLDYLDELHELINCAIKLLHNQ